MSRTKNPVKSCVPSENTGRKAIYHGVLILESHLEYRDLLEKIQFRENMVGVNFENLTKKEGYSEQGQACTLNVVYQLYSARDTIKDRLFCLVITLKQQLTTGERIKKKILVSLEMTEHDYDLSYKNKPACLKYRVQKILAELIACMENQANPACEKPATDRKYLLLNFNREADIPALEKPPVKSLPVTEKKSVILSTEQEASVRMPLPGIVSGNAGTGKTCVALAMHRDDILKDPEDKKKRLFVANTIYMKKEVRQVWEKMWLELRGKQDPESKIKIPENAEDSLCILTWKELIAEYYAKKEGLDLETVKLRLTFTRKEDLLRWYESDSGPMKSGTYRNYKALQGSLPEFEALRQDLDKIRDVILFLSGYTESEFLALEGERQCPYQGKDFRKFLYQEILESFKNFCKQENLEDERFFSMEAGYLDYALITVDESQNRSLRQLQSLFYCSANGSIAYFLDPRQQIQANYHLFQRLKIWLGEVQTQKVSSCSLNTCFRSSTQVIGMMNRTLQIRNQVCDSGKNEVGEVIAAKGAREGLVSAVFSPDKTQQEILQKKARDPATVVLVMHKEELEPAKNFYGPDAAIFTLAQAIGVEFACVIIHHPFSHSDFSQLNAYIRKAREGLPLEKGEAHVNLLPGFLYTLVSRAEGDVIWVLPAKTRNRQYLIEGYGLESLPGIQETAVNDSLKAREEQIVKFIIMGEWEKAQEFFLKFDLGKNEDDFKAFCKSKGMEKEDFPLESPKACLSSLPETLNSSESFTVANLQKWLNQKSGLFNPAAPEKSRFALILQDEKKIGDLLLLCKGKLIEKLDPKEFCRCYIYAANPNFLRNSPNGVKLLVAFLEHHSKAIAALFEELPSHSKAQPPAQKSKKSRQHGKKQVNATEHKPETQNLFSWLLLRYLPSLGILSNIHLNSKGTWLPHTEKKGFLEKNLTILSVCVEGHIFLANILGELEGSRDSSKFAELLQAITVETFSKCHLELFYSLWGGEIYAKIISSYKDLLYRVTKTEIDSGKTLHQQHQYSLKNLIHMTQAGKVIREALWMGKEPLSSVMHTNACYLATCHYIDDARALLHNNMQKCFLLLSENRFGVKSDQSALDFLLSRPQGHPFLLKIFQEEKDLLKTLPIEILKQDNVYRNTLFLSDYWEDFKALFIENNAGLAKAIQEYLNGETLPPVIPPTTNTPEKPAPAKKKQFFPGHPLNEAKTTYIKKILSDFNEENVLNLLNSRKELLNILLFTEISLDHASGKTTFLAEILKDFRKCSTFTKMLPPALNKLDSLKLRNFFLLIDSTRADAANFLDFFRFILEKMESAERKKILLWPFSKDARDCLIAEIAKDPAKYAIYLKTMSKKEILPTLDVFQLQLLFIEFADIRDKDTKKFFNRVLAEHIENRALLHDPLTLHHEDHIVKKSSLWENICDDAEKSLIFLNLLMDMDENITFWLFLNEGGCDLLDTIKHHKNTDIPKPFFKTLMTSEAGCEQLLSYLYNNYNILEKRPHPWREYLANIFDNFSPENGLILRNICSSSTGQLLLDTMFVTMPDLPINNRIFFQEGLNYKNEIFSPYQALHRSNEGIQCLYTMSSRLQYTDETVNSMQEVIDDRGYTPGHVAYLTTVNAGLKRKAMIGPKPPENFKAILSLCIDWLTFPDEKSIYNPLEQKIAFKTCTSMADILFYRLESMVLFYQELQKKPAISKWFKIEDLMLYPENPWVQPGNFFRPHLTDTPLGKKLLAFLCLHNKKLKKQIDILLNETFIRKMIMDPCPEKGGETLVCNPEKLRNFCRSLSKLQALGGSQLLQPVFNFLKKSKECQERFGYPVGLSPLGTSLANSAASAFVQQQGKELLEKFSMETGHFSHGAMTPEKYRIHNLNMQFFYASDPFLLSATLASLPDNARIKYAIEQKIIFSRYTDNFSHYLDYIICYLPEDDRNTFLMDGLGLIDCKTIIPDIQTLLKHLKVLPEDARPFFLKLREIEVNAMIKNASELCLVLNILSAKDWIPVFKMTKIDLKKFILTPEALNQFFSEFEHFDSKGIEIITEQLDFKALVRNADQLFNLVYDNIDTRNWAKFFNLADLDINLFITNAAALKAFLERFLYPDSVLRVLPKCGLSYRVLEEYQCRYLRALPKEAEKPAVVVTLPPQKIPQKAFFEETKYSRAKKCSLYDILVKNFNELAVEFQKGLACYFDSNDITRNHARSLWDDNPPFSRVQFLYRVKSLGDKYPLLLSDQANEFYQLGIHNWDIVDRKEALKNYANLPILNPDLAG